MKLFPKIINPLRMPEAPSNRSEFLLCQTGGCLCMEAWSRESAAWLAQLLIVHVYPVSSPLNNEHLRILYAERRLESDATTRKFRIVHKKGKRQVSRSTDHYNLEAMMVSGCQVRLHRVPLRGEARAPQLAQKAFSS